MKKTTNTTSLGRPFQLPLCAFEILISAALLVIEILYFIDALSLNGMSSGSEVGPGGFPTGIAIIAIVLTGALLLGSVIKLFKRNHAEPLVFNRLIYVCLSACIIVFIGGNLDSLGAFFAPWIMSGLIMFCCGERGKTLLIVPPCVGLAIYVLFVLLLGVYFP